MSPPCHLSDLRDHLCLKLTVLEFFSPGPTQVHMLGRLSCPHGRGGHPRCVPSLCGDCKVSRAGPEGVSRCMCSSWKLHTALPRDAVSCAHTRDRHTRGTGTPQAHSARPARQKQTCDQYRQRTETEHRAGRAGEAAWPTGRPPPVCSPLTRTGPDPHAGPARLEARSLGPGSGSPARRLILSDAP